jgi:hypothetical protein
LPERIGPIKKPLPLPQPPPFIKRRERDYLILHDNRVSKKVNDKKALQKLTYLDIFLDKRAYF